MAERSGIAVAGAALARALCVRALAVLVLLGAVAGCARDPEVALDAPNGAQRAAVRVELAQTPAKRELGLMYRNHMDENNGMLFVFPASERLRFWMKNTEIPLDMIFADSSGRIVGIVAKAEPYSQRPVGPDADAQYVLEVNGGFCARHGVRAGDRMRFVGFEPRASN
jgi:uncharacterized membrane protein (UPF0127 family)